MEHLGYIVEIKGFHIVSLLISGLDDRYETLFTALDAHPDNKLCLKYVKVMFMDKNK